MPIGSGTVNLFFAVFSFAGDHLFDPSASGDELLSGVVVIWPEDLGGGVREFDEQSDAPAPAGIFGVDVGWFSKDKFVPKLLSNIGEGWDFGFRGFSFLDSDDVVLGGDEAFKGADQGAFGRCGLQ